MPTGDFDPSDAIVQLGGGRKAFDVAKFVVGILRAEWKPENTGGFRPRIELAEVMKAVIFNQGDFVAVYTLTSQSEPVTLIYDFTNETTTFSLDLFTSRDRTHLTRIYEEVRRILLAHRRDTIPLEEGASGRTWLEWEIRSAAFDKTAKQFYRRTVDCRLNWRFRQIL